MEETLAAAVLPDLLLSTSHTHNLSQSRQSQRTKCLEYTVQWCQWSFSIHTLYFCTHGNIQCFLLVLSTGITPGKLKGGGIGYQGSNLGWPHARETPYLLYYHSNPSKKYFLNPESKCTDTFKINVGSLGIHEITRAMKYKDQLLLYGLLFLN